ncbi:50S ribosomal protein L30 [Symbiobacterium thermophilum]|uniref:Large ribosomal subunit protein uL30 n=2 Tax=Symbiobacterium thermophilum TaxID=2734 RepID=RL30_SYMTH|nr:50S ribosomal protein L30 [Symbiobacterium thermophilum]Q67JW1.1 RecName: Full=Large ribosomal subunit protein uL30; AltName: Full=50S ribosomal protein L30 [Symbiobacterium thermophilum IAM 14863]MBY6274772.1 50S ribosomal protein L30 [Symbiobacterium thermophilum]OTA41516.1 MAG: 50S ribosomal protein L30 [Symbiobacterium thermophilum]BAD42039.1 50S ribosomal protein L30 [Symbiobacterium thermophilum IAM 14863]
MAGTLKITLKKGLAGRDQRIIATLKSLGLTKLNKTVERPDNPAVRGMIARVAHMVEVQEG